MLEKQLRDPNHMKKQGFVSPSSPPTKNGYISVEEFVRDNSHNNRSLSTTFLLSTKGIFSTKRQDRKPYKLPAADHNLGS
jgi:hypothetical protein